MSYEGYEQHICGNGHRFDTGCGYAFDESVPNCPYCSCASAFCNMVDETNGEESGIIRTWDFCKLTNMITEECNHCNNVKIVAEPTYRIPTDAELNEYRMFWHDEPEEGGVWVRFSEYNEFYGITDE